MIVGWQKLKKELKLKEQKKQLNNVIISWKKLEKKLKLKEQKKQLNNMIIGWKKLKKKLEEETTEQHDCQLEQHQVQQQVTLTINYY